jgi:transcriptional regulator with GAF, ATPase, and Fis domain
MENSRLKVLRAVAEHLNFRQAAESLCLTKPAVTTLSQRVDTTRLRDERGEIIRWYATATDIEDRKQAEDRTYNENLALREEIDRSSMFEEIIGSSEARRKVLAQIARVAETESTVLIQGETGTGKELVGRATHRRLKRSARNISEAARGDIEISQRRRSQ